MSEKCKSCGAEIVFDAGKQSLSCPYCGTINKINRPEDTLADSFDQIVPMSVTPEEMDNAAHEYMASGHSAPDDMLEASTITTRERYYLPAFAFGIDYEATWTASFGFDRKEPYTAYRTVTRNDRTFQESYTDYRTVTDWRPANGNDIGAFLIAGYGGKNLAGHSLNPDKLATDAVNNGKPTAFNPSFVTGFDIENFSIPENKILEALQGDINRNIDQGVKTHGQGDRQRDWQWKARITHEAVTCAIPVGHVVFLYDGMEFHLWLRGYNGTIIHADPLPVDQGKKRSVGLGFWPGRLALAAAVITAFLSHFMLFSFIAPIIAYCYGFARRSALTKHSEQVRKSLLLQKQASNKTATDLDDKKQAEFAKAFQRPEKSLFAKTHNDKIVLPFLTLLGIAGAVFPGVLTALVDRNQSTVAVQPTQKISESARVRAENSTKSSTNTSVTYTDSEGGDYSLSKNDSGAVLKSPDATLYLGKNCDASSPQYGKGHWEWANGGFFVDLERKRIGFTRQEIDVGNDDHCATGGEASVVSQDSPALMDGAIDFVSALENKWSQDNSSALQSLVDSYAESVNFYGKKVAKSEILGEKQKFLDRWPDRQYSFTPDRSKSSCDSSSMECVVRGVVTWRVSSPDREKESAGTSEVEMGLSFSDGRFFVINEGGRTLSRQ